MNNKKLQNFDDIFGNGQEVYNNSEESITYLDIDSVIPFSKHPFKLYSGNRLEEMIKSINEHSVLIPIIVRRASGNKYETLSGHNRVNASKLAGKKDIPSIILENVNDDEAMLIVTETNLMQRSFSDMLYSERANALALYYDALKRQGKRNDLINDVGTCNLDEENSTCSQVGNKSLQVVGANFNMSKNSVARYIRLTKLNGALLNRVDKGQIAFIPAVKLSFLKEDEQLMLEEFIEKNKAYINLKRAELLKTYSKNNQLDLDGMTEILSNESETKADVKNTTSRSIRLNKDLIERFFNANQKNEEINEIIQKALEFYFTNIQS